MGREHEILRDYLDLYLKPDEGWLEVSGNSATYWQARLAQTTTVSLLPDGRAKWRIKTRIVEDVASPDIALQLCLALNAYAAGWSFAYDAESRSIDALIAACALPEWDTYLLRLSDKAKLSAWMADVFAERLARAVGGVPAFGHPEHQKAVRQDFDSSYYYAEAIRRRPEWLMDQTFLDYVPLGTAAQYIAGMVGCTDESVETNDIEFRMPVDTIGPGDRVWLMGGFATHPVMGEGFYSALAVGGEPSSAAPAQVSAMTWGLFNDPQANLLGGWSYGSRGLRFTQWNTFSEVRQQEQLDSWDGRGSGDLWGFTSTLIDPLNALHRVGLSRCPESGLDAEPEDFAADVAAALVEQARPAVELGLRQLAHSEKSSDPRLLWMQRSRVLAIAVWFDSNKPMVTSLEVCTLSDETEYLVCFRRQPFNPEYCIVGGGERGRLMTPEAIKAFLPGPLPNALALWSNPKAGPDEVPEPLRRRVFEVALASGQNLVAEAAWVKETRDRPWDLVTRGSVIADSVRRAAMQSAAENPSSVDHFAQWWSVVSDYDNVMANFICLPDAWDGAINSCKAYGDLAAFDVGPVVLTYARPGPSGRNL